MRMSESTIKVTRKENSCPAVVKDEKANANKYDIVYFVKESAKNEELRYSLRSLKNFPHNKVWFYGYCPKSLKPDKWVKVSQREDNKWKNVNKMLRKACQNPEITEDFWVFNDDFFVMEKIENPTNHYNGDLYKRIVDIENKYQRITPYTQLIRDVCKELGSLGCETKDYTLHVPMLVNKLKMLEILNLTDCIGYRSLYANYFQIGGEKMRDVKITSKNKPYRGGKYLSTDDNSFNGLVGEQIRWNFPDKCKYEN